MGSVAMLEREEGSGRGVGLVVDTDGKIAAVGYDSEIDATMQGGRGMCGMRMRTISPFSVVGCTFDHEIDASGQCVIPGLVDAHTHPVWEGDRVHEFAMKV